MIKKLYPINLIACCIVSLAWLVPTFGALLELPLGLFHVICFFILWGKRKAMDTRAKGLLSSYARIISAYAIIVTLIIYFIIHNGVYLRNDSLQFLLIFLVMGLPMFFAWYFVFCLKYVQKFFLVSPALKHPDVIDLTDH